ncbi:MAG: hypothetical protein V4482_06800 [Pseudomonadota bacterium]
MKTKLLLITCALLSSNVIYAATKTASIVDHSNWKNHSSNNTSQGSVDTLAQATDSAIEALLTKITHLEEKITLLETEIGKVDAAIDAKKVNTIRISELKDYIKKNYTKNAGK